MSGAYPVLPMNLTFREWSSQITSALKNIQFPLPVDEENWRGWATATLLLNPALSASIPLPDTVIFPDQNWQKWVTFFINNLNL